MVGLAGQAAVPRSGLRQRALLGVPAARPTQVMAVLGDFTPLVAADLDRRGVPRRGGLACTCSARAEIDRRADPRPGARARSACRSRSARRAPSTWPRSRRRWPSPTAWWWCDPIANASSSIRCPVGLVWGIGPVTQRRLADRGIRTIGQLAALVATSPCASLLGDALGAQGRRARPPTTTSAGASDRAGAGRSARSRRSVGATPSPELVRTGARSPRRPRRPAACGPSSAPGAPSPCASASPACAPSPARRPAAHPIATTLTLTEIAERLVCKRAGRPPRPTSRSRCWRSPCRTWSTSPSLQLELPLVPDEPERPGSPHRRRPLGGRPLDRRGAPPVRTQLRSATPSVALSEHGSVPDEFRELAEHEL